MSESMTEADLMCPNCVTPWKCNGPHLVDQTPHALSEHRPAFRTGAIEAAALFEHPKSRRGRPAYAAVSLTVGEAVITVQATPKGQKVYVTIEDPKGVVREVGARLFGKWTSLVPADIAAAADAARESLR